MSGDMLSRIKRRNQRPTVERDTSLVQTSESAAPAQPTQTTSPSTSTPPAAQATQSTQAIAPQPAASPPPQSAAAGATAIEAELAELPQVSQRRNIRLEVELESRLISLCQENDITIETFLEACYIEAEQNTRFKTEMVTEAKRRLKLRKQAGKLRRVLSQLRK